MQKLAPSDDQLVNEPIHDSELEDLPGLQQVKAGDDVRKLKQLVRQLELQLRMHRRATAQLESQLEKAKETLSYRLGYLLIHAPKNWANLRRLPGELLALRREAARRRSARRGPSNPSPAVGGERKPSRWRRPEQFSEDVLRVYLERGLRQATSFLETNAETVAERAAAFTRLSRILRTSDPPQSLELAQRGYELEPSPHRAKPLAFLQHACGEIRRPAGLLASLPPTVVLRPNEQERAVQIAGLARLQRRLPQIPERAPSAYEPIAETCLYLTASSLPFNVSGYTVRSHALVRAIKGAGFVVHAGLRPGYPADRGVVLSEANHEHDGITYHHLPGPDSRLMPLDEYLESAAQAVAQLARRVRPQVIHAASNHVNALPALIAARRLGIPFVYEVRGMWELTAATRNPDWEKTERFELEQRLETLAARSADQVFTLTEGLARDLAQRGVPRDRITLVPNAVDPGRFAPRPKDSEWLRRLGMDPETFTVVYAGSLLHYEGLDDVLRALAILAQKSVPARLVVAGDGEASESLRGLTKELGLEAQVHFIGKLEPNDVPQVWSLADAAVFARKPFRVCELVSPLKPLEPMMMGVPVVVSDVAALREMVRDGETGLVHDADDPDDLAQRLLTLALDARLRRSLGGAGRATVLRERTWGIVGARVVERYRAITKQQTDQPK